MSGAIKINGTSSGSTTITAPASGGDETIELSTALAAKANTADIVAPGLVLITSQTFSAVGSVSVNNCFTSDYDAYRVIISLTAASVPNEAMIMRLRASGTDNSSSNYYYAGNAAVSNNTSGYDYSSGLTTYWRMMVCTSVSHAAVDVISPFATHYASMWSSSTDQYSGTGRARYYGGNMTVNTAYDGFTISNTAGGTITGSVRIFGYQNA